MPPAKAFRPNLTPICSLATHPKASWSSCPARRALSFLPVHPRLTSKRLRQVPTKNSHSLLKLRPQPLHAPSRPRPTSFHLSLLQMAPAQLRLPILKRRCIQATRTPRLSPSPLLLAVKTALSDLAISSLNLRVSSSLQGSALAPLVSSTPCLTDLANSDPECHLNTRRIYLDRSPTSNTLNIKPFSLLNRTLPIHSAPNAVPSLGNNPCLPHKVSTTQAPPMVMSIGQARPPHSTLTRKFRLPRLAVTLSLLALAPRCQSVRPNLVNGARQTRRDRTIRVGLGRP